MPSHLSNNWTGNHQDNTTGINLKPPLVVDAGALAGAGVEFVGAVLLALAPVPTNMMNIKTVVNNDNGDIEELPLVTTPPPVLLATVGAGVVTLVLSPALVLTKNVSINNVVNKAAGEIDALPLVSISPPMLGWEVFVAFLAIFGRSMLWLAWLVGLFAVVGVGVL